MIIEMLAMNSKDLDPIKTKRTSLELQSYTWYTGGAIAKASTTGKLTQTVGAPASWTRPSYTQRRNKHCPEIQKYHANHTLSGEALFRSPLRPKSPVS